MNARAHDGSRLPTVSPFAFLLAAVLGLPGLAQECSAQQTVVVRSGNGAVGGTDSLITFLSRGAAGPFPSTFTEADFAAATSGPAAYITSPYGAPWITSLSADPQAQWIRSSPEPAGPTPTALMAVNFDITGTVADATLTLDYAIDNFLGAPAQAGVFLNGLPVPGTSQADIQSGEVENHLVVPNVGPLLQSGTNTMYLYMRNGEGWVPGNPAGLIFSATICVESAPAPVLLEFGLLQTGVLVGEPFQVHCTVQNSGGQGDHGGISISFPGLTDSDPDMPPYDGPRAMAATHSDTTFASTDVYYYDAGDPIDIGGTTGPALHLLVEGDQPTWLPGETKTLRLTVTALQPGPLRIRIRGWITKDGVVYRDPNSGDGGELDQQQYWAHALTVNVFSSQPPRRPFPQSQLDHYAPGTMKPTGPGHTQSQLDDDVRAAYLHWYGAYLVPAGTNSDGHCFYRISRDPNDGCDTVSEGQGYGMVIVAYMAGHEPRAQFIFDGLWYYSRAHASDGDENLMDWHVPANGQAEPNEDYSAFDGDADIAYALLLAHRQWGSDGDVNYLSEARTLLASIWNRTIGRDSLLPLLGDWVPGDGGNCDCGAHRPCAPNAPPSSCNRYTHRTSDLMPAHFATFARVQPEHDWAGVRSACQDAAESLQAEFAPQTGFLPDFVIPKSQADHTPKPAAPCFMERDWDGDYSVNACRDPWRFSLDALLNRSVRSRDIALKMTRWVRARTVWHAELISSGYLLDGSPINEAGPWAAFAAPLGVAAMNDLEQDPYALWLTATYDAARDTVGTPLSGYYQDTITLLCLVIMSGNYWDPWPADVPPGDLDQDGYADISDFGLFGGCMAGPGLAPPETCGRADLDQDTDVDLKDFEALQTALGQ